jgi:hypothetical protein
LRELRKALTKAGESGLPPRGLPHHDQEKIAREGNYYLFCGLENRPNKSGVFVYEKLYLFQQHRDHPGHAEHIMKNGQFSWCMNQSHTLANHHTFEVLESIDPNRHPGTSLEVHRCFILALTTRPTQPLFRFYGPTEALFNKTFVLNDIELVK